MRETGRTKLRGTAFNAGASVVLLLLSLVCLSGEARAQWATNGNHIHNTNPGNVGVGTSTPESILHAHGSEILSTGAAAGFKFRNRGSVSATDDWVWYSDGNVARFWRAGKGDVLGVNTAGNFGVGTTSPAARLHATVNTASAAATLLVVPDSSNYYAGNTHEGLVIDGSNTHVHGLYTGATLNLMRVRSGNNWDTMVVGRFGDTHLTPRTGSMSHTLRLSPDSGNGYYAQHAHDVFLINGTSTGPHGLYGGGALRLMRVTNTAGADVLTIQRDGTTNFGGNVGVGAPSPAAKLHVAGDIRVDGNIAAKYRDVAEWVPSTQQLAAGTVVVLDAERTNHVLASSRSYDTRVAGVVSARPGISLGEAGEDKALVATTGRVKVRVDATREAIRVGDLLVTSDVPGVAMKSLPLDFAGTPLHRPGTIIGKALEPLDKGTGEILVLLSMQ
ncbi:MAG TPA: hypothetical protein VGV38_21965 [Pyrinomonadaceae bacterium]|nr:hypothetical protein [Pyrinomonadaceae bacterium]